MVVLRLIVGTVVGWEEAFRKMRNDGQTLQSPFTSEILTSLVLIVARTAGNKRTFITGLCPRWSGVSFERALFSVDLAFFRRVFHPAASFPQVDTYDTYFLSTYPITRPLSYPTFLKGRTFLLSRSGIRRPTLYDRFE